MMAARIGLRLDPGLRARLTRTIEDEAAAMDLTLERYSERLLLDPTIFQRLLNRITVQQTSFFRDPDVFDALATEVLPKLKEPVVAWSAGCSYGQEAYSLAMLLQESGLREWTVLGTDISTSALDRAKLGAFSDAELGGVSPERRRRHFQRTATGWEVLPALRDRLTFQHHNLGRAALPIAAASCHLILCRNVLIYFSQKELLRLLDRFAAAIRNDGYLVLGASESLWQLSASFRLNRVGDVFMYRLPSTEATPERRRSQPRQVTLGQLLGQGEAAAAAGDYAGAAEAFRHATLLDPGHPVPYFQLALCLERAGQGGAAREALAAAQLAILSGDTARFETDLAGFHVNELIVAIERRLGA